MCTDPYRTPLWVSRRPKKQHRNIPYSTSWHSAHKNTAPAGKAAKVMVVGGRSVSLRIDHKAGRENSMKVSYVTSGPGITPRAPNAAQGLSISPRIARARGSGVLQTRRTCTYQNTRFHDAKTQNPDGKAGPKHLHNNFSTFEGGAPSKPKRGMSKGGRR